MDDEKLKKQLKFRIDQLMRMMESGDISDKRVIYTLSEQTLNIESSSTKLDSIISALMFSVPILLFLFPSNLNYFYVTLLAFIWWLAFWDPYGTTLFSDKKLKVDFYNGSLYLLSTSPIIVKTKSNFQPHFTYKPVEFQLANIQDVYVKDVTNYRTGYVYSKLFIKVDNRNILTSCLESEEKSKHIAKFILDIAKLHKQHEKA